MLEVTKPVSFLLYMRQAAAANASPLHAISSIAALAAYSFALYLKFLAVLELHGAFSQNVAAAAALPAVVQPIMGNILVHL